MDRPSRVFSVYMAGIGLLGWLLLAWLLSRRYAEGVEVSLVWNAGFFLGLAILVGLQPLRLPRGAVRTVGLAIDYSYLLIFGPAVAGLIGVISETVLLWRSPGLKKLFNQGQVIFSFAGAGLVYEVLGGRYVQLRAEPVPFGELGLALVCGGVASFTISSLLISIAISQRERRPVAGVWAVSFRRTAPRFLALAPFGLLMAMVYQTPELGIVAVALCLVPVMGVRYAFRRAAEAGGAPRDGVGADECAGGL
jgi:hypothetical protein